MNKIEILHSEFCLHFKEVRQQQLGSQGKLSSESDIDTSDISNYERGNKNPALHTLLKLADGMGCDLRLVPREKK